MIDTGVEFLDEGGGFDKGVPYVFKCSVSPLSIVSDCSRSFGFVNFVVFKGDEGLRGVKGGSFDRVVIREGNDFEKGISFIFKVIFTKCFKWFLVIPKSGVCAISKVSIRIKNFIINNFVAICRFFEGGFKVEDFSEDFELEPIQLGEVSGGKLSSFKSIK